MTNQELSQQWIDDRQKARTDLYWLSNSVLSFPNKPIMSPRTHQIMVDHCQKFHGWLEAYDKENPKLN